MSFRMQALIDGEDSLHELAESIRRAQTGWFAVSTSTNGAAGGDTAHPESLRQLISDLGDIVRRCENLPGGAVSLVESTWQSLEADELGDWDVTGREVLELLTKQAEAVAEAADLISRAEASGLIRQSRGKLSAARSLVSKQSREFLDSWPWSTGNKPGDEEDAAAARRALQALPSFEELSRLARRSHPPVEDAQEKFNRLARQWREERGPSSSARRMAAHPAYREIVAMGRAAVPFLLAELQRQPDHWFIALHEITGADPVLKEGRGRPNEMVAAWVKWGKENGFLS
jgi:hypothetical protein